MAHRPRLHQTRKKPDHQNPPNQTHSNSGHEQPSFLPQRQQELLQLTPFHPVLQASVSNRILLYMETTMGFQSHRAFDWILMGSFGLMLQLR
ncbi:hypothetical protein ACSBR1_033507 [Camellia fascicularis]